MFAKNDRCWFVQGGEVKLGKVWKVGDGKISVIQSGCFEAEQIDADKVFATKEQADAYAGKKE